MITTEARYLICPNCGRLLNDDTTCVIDCPRFVGGPPRSPVYLTVNRILTESERDSIRERWIAEHGGRHLNRGRAIGETSSQYLTRIIDRMDWHIARLRRLG